MSHRRVHTFHALPILGAIATYGCGQPADRSQPVGLETTTGASPATATSPSTSPVHSTTAPSVEMSSAPGPSTSGQTSAGSNAPVATTTPDAPSAPSAPGTGAETSSAELTGGEISSAESSGDTADSDRTGETSSDGATPPAATSGEPLDSSDAAPTSEDSPPDDGNVIHGQGGVVNSTITVRAGEIFDGGGKTFTAGNALGDGSQDEDQLPVFRLEDGAQLRNVTLGSPAADGIHCYGDVTLNDIHWQDIGEDALTIKESGTVVLDGGSAQNGDDKVFQINAASTFIVRNFTARNAGKFIRQNGDTTFRVDVVIENCDISQMDECIFRTDSSTSTVTMRDTRYSDLGDGLFVGVNQNNITLSNNTEY